ncbi:MAG: transcriptional regulator [Methanophagales archaeon ANME-1-THS]|nr:MAG: transcriptional regulator [Methanophagales archaeon ANME-1-THS]
MEEPKGPRCQSCGMPMTKAADFGTNADRSKNEEYCIFCYANGRFRDEGITMEEKIEKNVAMAKKMGWPEDKAREMASTTIPNLKRWKK